MRVIIQDYKEYVVTCVINRKYLYSIIFYGMKALVFLEYLIVEASRLHTEIPRTVGLLWTSDWSDA
jgi:hypothetical protein